jgi:Glycosyltransferase (GlcNAc)
VSFITTAQRGNNRTQRNTCHATSAMIEDGFRSPIRMRRRNWNADSTGNTQRHRIRSRSKRNIFTRSWQRATLGLVVTAVCVALTFVVKHHVGPVELLRQKKQRRRPVPLDPEIVRIRQQFPQAAEEMEEIPHPGIIFAGSQRAKILLPGLDFPESLTVPKFWNPPEYGLRGVRHFLGESGKRLITPEEAQSIGTVTKDGKETIFVSLASYRDTECRSTLESIFLRAARPERIRVGVVDQVEPKDPRCAEPALPCDKDPEQTLCRYRHLINVYEVPSFLMVGPVLARHVAHRMYRGT